MRLDYWIKLFLLFLRPNLVRLRRSTAEALERKWHGFGVHGQLSEWLGIGLQNRLRRFESATDLKSNNKPAEYQRVLYLLVAYLVAKAFSDKSKLSLTKRIL